MVRSAWTPIAPWAICRRPCATISCVSVGAMATRRSCRRRTWSVGSISTPSGGRRRASISPSSRTSTGIISGPRQTRRSCRGSRLWCLELPIGGTLAAKIDAEGWRKLQRALPGLKDRAKTLVELLDSADYLLASAPSPSMRKPRSCSTRPGAKSSARCCRSLRASSPGRGGARCGRAGIADEAGLKLGKVAHPPRRAHRTNDLTRHLRCA